MTRTLAHMLLAATADADNPETTVTLPVPPTAELPGAVRVTDAELADLLGGALDNARRDLASVTAERDRLRAALDEVLRNFHEKGHPGRPCLRTGWIHVDTVDRWRAILDTRPNTAEQVSA